MENKQYELIYDKHKNKDKDKDKNDKRKNIEDYFNKKISMIPKKK